MKNIILSQIHPKYLQLHYWVKREGRRCIKGAGLYKKLYTKLQSLKQRYHIRITKDFMDALAQNIGKTKIQKVLARLTILE